MKRLLPLLMLLALPPAARASSLATVDQIPSGAEAPQDAAMPVDPAGDPTTNVTNVVSAPSDVSGISQSGVYETATVTQAGADDVSTIQQSGSYEVAVVTQLGQGDISSIVQSGSHNSATVTQSSDFARSTIVQSGFGNVAIVRQ